MVTPETDRQLERNHEEWRESGSDLHEFDPSQPIKVLLAEDSEHDRRYFRRILDEGEGNFDLSEAIDGPSALEKLKNEKYDVFVVDLNMPGMDGIDVIRKSLDRLSETGVMVLTGSPDLDSAVEAIGLRVRDYLVKSPREQLKEQLPRRVATVARNVHLLRENRRLERELRVRLAHLEQIHEQMPDTIFATIAEDLTLADMNRHAYKLLGVEEDEIQGKSIVEILKPFSTELAELVEDLLKNRRPAHNVYVERANDGDDRLLLLTLAPASGSNETFPWILTLRDVTPQRRERSEIKGANFRGIIGRDPAIVEMCNLIRRVAPLPTSVLITGPTGAGKEVVGNAIHAESDRAHKPFIAVNCTALSREILESELFGHVRGSFTGAITSRRGRFREADGGTLFLDEIGDTSEAFQSKLLRVLETGEIEPVGQDRPIKVDVRIICATNQDLKALVAKGLFRKDLYYRIDVVHIRVPSLAERPGDLPLLVDAFRREFNKRFKKNIRAVSQDAMRALARHDWPGNVRELRHVLEHAFVVAEGVTITRSDLPVPLSGGGPRDTSAPAPMAPPEPEMDPRVAGNPQAQDEVARIRQALKDAGGNIAKASELLGIHRTTLWRKMQVYNIKA